MVFRWAVIVILAVIAVALIAGPDFGRFLLYLAGILLLGVIVREIDKAKRRKEERRRNNGRR